MDLVLKIKYISYIVHRVNNCHCMLLCYVHATHITVTYQSNLKGHLSGLLNPKRKLKLMNLLVVTELKTIKFY